MVIQILNRLDIKCGSISFPGCTDSYIQIPYKENMRPNTNDFTIEWFQYMEHAPTNRKQVVFSIGKPPNCALGVTFFFKDDIWHMGFHLDGINYYICPTEILNTWVHFAILRKGREIIIFKDGSIIQDSLYTDCNLNYTTPELSIGNYPRPSIKYAFKGCISNFRWTVGKCIYTEEFIVPSKCLSVTSDTKLLLLMKRERDMFIDTSRNIRNIRLFEGRYSSPAEDSADGCNKIMWLPTIPFSSA